MQFVDVKQPSNDDGPPPNESDQTLGSRELMRILEQKAAKSAAAKASAAAAAAKTTAAPDKENEADNNQNRDDLMRMIEQRLGGCKVTGTKTTTTHHSKPKAVPVTSARSQHLPPQPPAAANRRPATITSSASSSSQSSPNRRAAKHPESKTRRPQASAPVAVPTVPSAYNYKEIYERKLQQRQKQMLEEERKAREVVARPMPNFSVAHRQLEQQQMAKRAEMPPTCPNTPQTLRVSRDAAERRKQRVSGVFSCV